MKYIQGQKSSNYAGQITCALDGVDEANQLVREALGDSDFINKSMKEFREITRANTSYKVEKNIWGGDYAGSLREALQQIEHGNPEIDAEINALAKEYEEYAKNIEPSLTLDSQLAPSEEGEQFDAGKIASEDPMAFFVRSAAQRPKSGKGDGAFRILINTDVSWWGDPTKQCAALMAIVNLMQRQAPVEIWVQQGWVGSKTGSGVTLFKVFSGGQILTKHLYFWVGSPYKDNPYSFVVNKKLGRKDQAVSLEPEIPCDLYIYPQFMPKLGHNDEAFKAWVTQTSRQMLFDEELPNGWCGAESGNPAWTL